MTEPIADSFANDLNDRAYDYVANRLSPTGAVECSIYDLQLGVEGCDVVITVETEVEMEVVDSYDKDISSHSTSGQATIRVSEYECVVDSGYVNIDSDMDEYEI